nr:hypothetical protein [Pseudoclavibacter helvolus]
MLGPRVLVDERRPVWGEQHGAVAATEAEVEVGLLDHEVRAGLQRRACRELVAVRGILRRVVGEDVAAQVDGADPRVEELHPVARLAARRLDLVDDHGPNRRSDVVCRASAARGRLSEVTCAIRKPRVADLGVLRPRVRVDESPCRVEDPRLVLLAEAEPELCVIDHQVGARLDARPGGEAEVTGVVVVLDRPS